MVEKEWITRGLYVSYAILSYIDLKQTESVTREEELNPIARYFWENKGLLKLIFGGVIIGISELLNRENENWALFFMLVANLIQGGAVVWNAYQLLK